MIKTYLVDDEASILGWLTDTVEWTHYDCMVVRSETSAMNALDAMRQEKIDLLVTDIRMPDLNGLNLIARAKELHPALHVIIISAHDNFEYAREALKMGADNYLLKPIDLQELHDALQSLAEEQRKTEAGLTYTNDIRVYRNNILQRWVKNAAVDGNFAEQAQIADLDLASDSYAVLAVSIGEENHSILPDVFQYCNEESAFGANYFFIDSRLELVGILPNWAEDGKTRLRRFYVSLSERFPVNLHLCVGRSVASYRDVGLSYKSAMRYLPAMYSVTGPLFFCDDLEGNFAAELPSLQDELTLANHLKTNNHKAVLQIALSLLELSPSVREKREAALSFAMLLLERMETNGNTISQPLLRSLGQYRSLHTVEDIVEWIQSLIQKVLYQVSVYASSLHPNVSKAIDMLRTGYIDPELSLQGMADYFAVSPAYFGQLFHSQTGRYFNDYLTEIRLDAACRLLAESKERIGDIAAQVGFSSQSYLNRVFKKKYWLSPLEYRRGTREALPKPTGMHQ